MIYNVTPSFYLTIIPNDFFFYLQAREANHVGDQMGAERSSRMAKTLNHVGLGLGIGFTVLIIIYAVVMAQVMH